MDFLVSGVYILRMSERVSFTGTILRFEPDGFGIVEFDSPIGPDKKFAFGLISNSTGTIVFGGAGYPLKPGTQVAGEAETDDRQVAAVKTVTVQSSR
jgi:hypothetical protein